MSSLQVLRVMVVVGSLHKTSSTRDVLRDVEVQLAAAGCTTDWLDLLVEPLPLFNPDSAYHWPGYDPLKKRVELADAFVLGTPDYHGSVSSAMKNFLDHFWREFTGKLFASLVSSHEKGLTVTDQLRTVARQCYAWSMPYGVSFVESEDVKDGSVASKALRARLKMLARDVRVYGELLAAQRRNDLEGTDPGFMARLR